MTTTLEIEYTKKTENELVREWRLEQLAGAGYDDRAAAVLARRNDVDLHLAVDLLRRGCPRDTALRILL